MTRALRFCTVLVALSGASACSDSHSSSSVLPPTVHPLSGIATLRGTVDVAAGTLTFEPIAPPGGGSSTNSGISAAIYGNQGTTVRIYNSAVVTSAPNLGTKTYSANVGLRNLLGYRIGDEQGAAAPPDTMGIYVFVNGGPRVTGTSSSCPACAVTVNNARGVLNFNAPNQQYWFWPEVVGPANGGADTTLNREPWIFQADTAVTGFTFDVLVSAPWVAPNETRWKIDYEGDSLPDTQSEPRWRLRKAGNGTYTNTAGTLDVNPGPGAEISFYRRDSLAATTSAYMEAAVNYPQTKKVTTARLVIDDNGKFIALGVNGAGVGFVNPSNTFLGTPVAMNTAAYHTYQLRKYAADSAVFFIDNSRGGKLAYTGFAATPYSGIAPLLQFGVAGPDNGDAVFDYVVYEIGTPFP